MFTRCRRVVLFSLMFLAIEASAKSEVESFTPQGTVRSVKQVTARFSENIVAFGDPRQVAPFDMKCPEKGQARWVDTRNWAFDFEKDLPAGVICEFKLKPDLKTLSGKAITGTKIFSFSTGGPAIRRSSPYEGSNSVQEDQVFVLRLDAVPDENSVVANTAFSITGIQERVGVKLIKGGDREKILKASYVSKEEALLTVLVQAKQRFPAGKKVSLIWGKGVKSKTGVATDTDQVLPFEVREPLKAEFTCERENIRAGCVPLNAMSIRFSAQIPKAALAKIVLKDAQGKVYKGEQDTGDEHNAYSQTFKGPFPESTAFSVLLPGNIEDDAGRKLSNGDKFPLSVTTEAYPPLAKFAGTFGIIELKGNGVLPVTVRNLEPDVTARLLKYGKNDGILDKVKNYLGGASVKKAKVGPDRISEILYWLKRVDRTDRDHSVFAAHKNEKAAPVTGKVSNFKLPKREDPKAFEVMGIPLEEPGLYILELESSKLGASLLGKQASMYVPTAVLVTNLGVHFKSGRESSLAWVTTLETGKPAAGAAVQVRDCSGKVLWSGTSGADGLARMEKLPMIKDTADCSSDNDYSSLNSGLLVTAQHGNDMSFVHSSWENGIESWRFGVSTDSWGGAVLARTVLDRSLLRAGDTIHMKHFLRRHTREGFAAISDKDRPTALVIQHDGSEQKYNFALKWDAGGIAESTWQIPKEAKLGTYSINLAKGKKQETSVSSGTFRVEEFRVPLMKAVIQAPSEALVAPSKFAVDLAVSYLAGGGASNAAVKFRSQIQPRGSWSFDDYEDFTFANGTVKEGRQRTDSEESEQQEEKAKVVATQDLTLDKAGTARTTVGNLPKSGVPYTVLTELQFNDPNGEAQTVASSVPVFPAKTLIGIKPDSWAASKEDLRFHVSVVDLKGRGVANSPVKVDLLERKTFSHRKRIVGGFYAYEHYQETKKITKFCEGKTDGKGLLVCQGKSPLSGNVIAQAYGKDGDGNKTAANREVWVAGSDDWWFSVQDNDRMDVIPEKKRYEPGQLAKFQIRMPFRDATALVAVEREGVMDVYVRDLSGKSPFVEIPIKPNYAPNVYVSILAVRGRAGEIKPTALVDLGRPAYKLGIGEVNVGWRGHELKVKVLPEKSVYRVRDKAKVRISVRTPQGKAPASGEIALAAVDEGLLELMPNQTWQLLESMMGRRPYEVNNSTAQMHVVGKRHFGLKAIATGGGGGNESTRELFDTLLLWKGRVKLNKSGDAVVTVPLNDSITSFRIVAVANAGLTRYGTGSASIRATQDLMLFSGIPLLVREGDRLRASFTLRNTTTQKMDVALKAKVTKVEELVPLQVALAAGEAKEVGWDIKVPNDVPSLDYEIEATEATGRKDRIKVTQRVVPAVPVRTFQATVSQLEKEIKLPVERPADAIAGRGGVQVHLKSSLLNGMTGIREYMQAYPYTCLEQQVSRAVALRDKKLWKETMAKLPSYLDGNGLAKFFPIMERGEDSLTSYVLSLAAEAGWEIPEAPRNFMAKGLTAFVEGSVVVGSTMPTSDLSVRKIAALEALSRYGEKTVEPKLLSSITIEPNLWPTSAVIDWYRILLRGEALPRREESLKQVEQVLKARINFQGTTMNFSTDKSDNWWWLMVSTDVNAVRAVLTLLPLPQWKEDMPRLMKGALGRQTRGHWDLTTANAWGVLALEKFASRFEKVPVGGNTRVVLAPNAENFEWKTSPPGKSLTFPWPEKKENVGVTHDGPGKPWVFFQALAAIPLKEAFWAGYRIEKSVKAIEQKHSGRWSRGDLARVRLTLKSDADMTWVVVSDPIPSGASILGGGLGRDSSMATQGEKREGWVWPSFEEKSFEAFRSYYQYVPKGEWVTEYTIRLNNEGSFGLPASRVEAMYAPEMFGELPNARWEVAP